MEHPLYASLQSLACQVPPKQPLATHKEHIFVACALKRKGIALIYFAATAA